MPHQTIHRSIAVTDGITVYTARPSSPSTISIVVLGELFGLTPHALAVCDQLAAAGAEVACPDLFHRTPGTVVLPEDDAGRAAGFGALRCLTAGDLVSTVAAAATNLSRAVEQCGLLGLSVGGYAGFLAAARMPFARAALVYPGWLASSTPPIAHDRPALDELDAVTGRLLVVVGSDDRLIGPADQTVLAERLVDPHELLVLPGIGHGFLSPTRAAYDAEAAGMAWTRVTAHLVPG